MSQQDNTIHHPVLPRLKENSGVANFKQAGVWESREAGELEVLSDSLKVEKVVSEVNSIPDMWARPLLFEMALYDGGHLLHDRVVGEWRGLLAMLGLKEVAGIFDLTAVPISVPPPGDDGQPQGAPQAGKFLTALSKLVPRKSLSADTSWHQLYVFLYGGKPFGLTSPTTLVATATEYYNRISNSVVPWFDGRYLTDPSAHLTSYQKKSLAGWLNEVRGNLIAEPDVNKSAPEFEELLGLIGSFIHSLGGVPQSPTVLSTTGLKLESGIFNYLDKPVKGEEPDPHQSHVRLMPSPGRNPSPAILVVDKGIATQWRVPEQSVLVWGTIPLATAVPFGGFAGQRNQIAGRTLKGAEVWEPEMFFTEKLFVIAQEEAFSGAMKLGVYGSQILNYQQQAVTPILPVEKTLVEHLSADSLSERVTFEQTTDGGILVRLRLPLAGPDQTGKDFEVSKQYRAKDNEIVLLESVPVLEIWPNFVAQTPDWKAYFTYYSTGGATSTFYAEPHTPGVKKAHEPQRFLNSRNEVVRCITRTEVFPEVMLCRAAVANPQQNRMEPCEAGIILIDQPKPLPQRSRTFKVGIDFGATSTNVYLKEGANDPKPVIFRDRFLKITASGDIKRVELYDYFLPGQSEDTPFLSIFHDFETAEGDDHLRPLLDGHVYFLDDYTKFDANKPGMAVDLKWSERAEDRYRVRAFLEQVCLQTAAEAVSSGAAKIIWAYSFPTAFSTKMGAGFPQIWEQVTRACDDAAGLSHTSTAPLSRTESESSALFFRRHMNASIEMGTVCIDIGGSTSDVAVWQEKLRWQTSVRLAGRDIFLNYLRANPAFLGLFGIDTERLQQSAGNRAAFYAQADAVVGHERERLFGMLPSHAATKDVQQLMRHVALGLSGLFYYVGSVLKYLMDSGNYKEEPPNVYIGGNGAHMFHWLDAGAYGKRSPVNGLFRGVLLHAAGLDESAILDITISPTPKAEAAYGLVLDEKLESSGADRHNVVSGESFKEAGQERAWNSLLSAEAFKKQIEVPPRFEKLSDFIDSFNRHASSTGVVPPVTVTDHTWREVRHRTAGTLAEYRAQEDVQDIQVEPLFIVALKHLLELSLDR